MGGEKGQRGGSATEQPDGKMQRRWTDSRCGGAVLSPKLPTLHLFPPSPPSKHTVGPALDGNDDSSPATTAADDPESTAVPIRRWQRGG